MSTNYGGLNLSNKLKIIITLGCVGLLYLGVGYQSQTTQILDEETSNVHQKIIQLSSFSKVDQKRTKNIQKVLSVLNRYNSSMSFDRKYAIASEISDASMKYENLDINLLCATITHESAFTWDPAIVSPAGALGLMQVMPETGKFLASIEGLKWTSQEDILFDPVINIRLGSRYLSSLIELYDIDGGLAAYNGGGKIARMWLANGRADGILYQETQNYVPAVLSLYKEFRN